MISEPYLLALDVPVHRSGDGSIWADPLWAQDLARHFRYLADLTVFVPMTHGVPAETAVRVPLPPTVRFVEARQAGIGGWRYVARLPALLLRTWREVVRSRIVHTGVAGHPFPIGWFAIPMARLLDRHIVVMVESAFWRLSVDERATRRRRLRAEVWERVNRWCLRQATYAGYSHDGYRRSLPAPRADGGVLFQASWVNEEQIVSRASAEAHWETRTRAGGPIAALFATRLVPEKGTGVVLQAIEALRSRGTGIELHVMGTGPERERFAAAAREGGVGVRLVDPVPYGPAFFETLRRYDVLIAPSLSDEQPRVVYDAASQAVPTVASDLPGMRACIDVGRTGEVFAAGNGAALADVLAGMDRAACRRLGLAARDRATRHTHEDMHEERRRHLERLLAR